MKIRLLLLPALLLLVGCEDLKERLYQTKMKTVCEVLEARCRFQNQGDPAETCARIQVTRNESGEKVESELICSGRLKIGEEVLVPITWPRDVDILAFCMGPELSSDFRKSCTVKVEVPAK